MIELYVAVVTMAGTLPVGFYLGLRYAAARAELRRAAAPHEALAAEAIVLGLRGPLPGRRPIPEARGDRWGV